MYFANSSNGVAHPRLTYMYLINSAGPDHRRGSSGNWNDLPGVEWKYKSLKSGNKISFVPWQRKRVLNKPKNAIDIILGKQMENCQRLLDTNHLFFVIDTFLSFCYDINIKGTADRRLVPILSHYKSNRDLVGGDYFFVWFI